MRVFAEIVLVTSLFSSTYTEQSQCEKDDLSCVEGTSNGVVEESAYNSYKNKKWTSREDFAIREKLDVIDKIKSGDPEGALKQVQEVLNLHPESPRALNSLSKIYRIMFNKLSPEFHGIGRNEYLGKMMNAIFKIIKMDKEKVPFGLFHSVAEFGIANAKAMDERQLGIDLLHELVFGSRREEFSAEDNEFYFQSLLDESFLSGLLTECKELIIQRTTNVTVPSINMRLMMAVITRIEESKEAPFVRYPEGMLESITPEGQEEKEELFLYVNDLEKELRALKRVDIINIIYDFLVEIKMYPSRYQRTGTHMSGLTARPVWTIEQTGYEDKLMELQNNWKKIRDEALELFKHAPTSNITMGEKDLDDNKKWKQYMLHGFGEESFPSWVCDHVPTTCDLLKDYLFATKCPLGTIKFSVIEQGAHIKPHVSGHNFRLRAHLPLVVPERNKTEAVNMARMVVAAEHELVWEEGKMFVFDDSFEHEVWNYSSGPRVVLIIDLIHPDMTQEQFHELENMFKFNDVGADSGSVGSIANVAVSS